MQIDARAWALAASLVTLTSFAGDAAAAQMLADPAATCSGLTGPADGCDQDR